MNRFKANGKPSSGVVEGFNNEAKLTMRKSQGYRTFRGMEIALNHGMSNLPVPKATHSSFSRADFFMVLKGNITIKMRDGDVHLSAGEMYVFPKGVEHCPVAEEEAHLLLIEPQGTPNTGDAATAAKVTKI